MTFENNEILDVQAMCNVFRQLRSFEKLESLNFRCNKNFNDDIVAALAEGITLKKELRTVDLGENNITDRGIQILGEALRTHVRLHMLFLDSNSITANGAEGLSECLKNK
jgi:Ran GTPase-activating protein (RanGAP) involved in mRNA processing and transport